MAITATLNATAMPAIELDFIHTPTENAVDVQTLSGDLYTDFVSQEYAWTFNYESLTQAEYDALRAIYDLQFTIYEYPTLSIPYYSLASKPVRMFINEKNIWNNCGSVQNVQFTFRETSQLPEVS
jgi:hypothetical protein